MAIVPEKDLRFAFRLSLLAKGIFAIVEIVGGVFVYFVSQKFLYDLASTVTQNEIAGDANDYVGYYLSKLAENFSVPAQHFTAFYLASHGIIKLFLIMGLLKQRLWAYPAALIVFTLFIVYQLYRYNVTHSSWLVVVSVLDLFVIALTLHEYRYLRKLHATTTDSQELPPA